MTVYNIHRPGHTNNFLIWGTAIRSAELRPLVIPGCDGRVFESLIHSEYDPWFAAPYPAHVFQMITLGFLHILSANTVI